VKFLLAIVPTLGVTFLFWVAIKAMVEADRRERKAQARIEAAEDAAARVAGSGSATPTAPGGSGTGPSPPQQAHAAPPDRPDDAPTGTG
jgi:hypothetical protein